MQAQLSTLTRQAKRRTALRQQLLLRLLYAPPPEDMGLMVADAAAPADAMAGTVRGLLLLLPPPLEAADAKGSGLRPKPCAPDLLAGRLLLGDRGGWM